MSQSSDVTSYDDPPRQATTADRTVTVLLMICWLPLVPIASFFGLAMPMGAYGCADGSCNDSQVHLGSAVGTVAPPIVYVATLVWVLVRFGRALPAWWVVLLGMAVSAALWWLGAVFVRYA